MADSAVAGLGVRRGHTPYSLTQYILMRFSEKIGQIMGCFLHPSPDRIDANPSEKLWIRHQWRIQGALPPPPPRTKIFLISCSFWKKIWHICMLAPPQRMTPPPTGNPRSAPCHCSQFPTKWSVMCYKFCRASSSSEMCNECPGRIFRNHKIWRNVHREDANSITKFERWPLFALQNASTRLSLFPFGW